MEEWKNPETISIWITIIIVFVLLLATSIVILSRSFFRKLLEVKLKESETQLLHQKELLNASVNAQESERKRIAADLHDDLIGNLLGVQLKHQLNQHDSSLENDIQQCIVRAREISHDLCPPMIEHLSLVEILNEISEEWGVHYEVKFEHSLQANKKYSTPLKLHLSRIVKELFNNVHKHAKAKRVDIRLRTVNEHLVLIFKDDGVGCNPEAIARGIGMKNLEARVQYLGGEFKIKSEPGKGTRVILSLN